ncbi:MAG: cation-translocating P-type ATPase, partial [Candidatus Aminicenantes bacterium]|nr:cation-translocating P-type ATPase [Candidatus Aminicenantes bacterium]
MAKDLVSGMDVKEEDSKELENENEAKSGRIDLPIVGMSCASCASTIQKGLSGLKGVEQASVNFANSKATVLFQPQLVKAADIISSVRKSGYEVLEVPPEEDLEDVERIVRQKEFKKLKIKFFAGLILGLIIFLGSMPRLFPWAPAFLNNFFVLWILATPVQFWIGWQFYRGAWGAFRHRNADMNTLIAVGTSAAYLYSVVATVSPSFFKAGGIKPEVFFDTSAMIIVLILLGRLLEARAKGQTSEAIKKLAGLQAKTARVIRDGKTVDIPIEEVLVGDEVVVRPGEKIPV